MDEERDPGQLEQDEQRKRLERDYERRQLRARLRDLDEIDRAENANWKNADEEPPSETEEADSPDKLSRRRGPSALLVRFLWRIFAAFLLALVIVTMIRRPMF